MLNNKSEELLNKISNLPDERTRAFEKKINNLSLEKDSKLYIQAANELLENNTELTKKDRLSLVALLCTYHRHMKNFDEQRKIIRTYRTEFSDNPLFTHLRLLQYVDLDFEQDLLGVLNIARSNIEKMDFNYGARHLFSDLVAQAFEEEKITLDNEENIKLLKDAHTNVEVAIMESASESPKNIAHPKFYCTLGRILAMEGDFKNALSNVKKAIDCEDSTRDEYSLRISYYQTYLVRITAMRQQSKLIEKFVEIDEKSQRITNKMDEVENAQTKNLEFLGLFAGIISFTIGTINIASNLASISFTGAAGLIIVLFGTLLCVFAGFGIVLNSKKENLKRYAAVFIIGLLIIIGGVLICYYV